MAKAYRLRVRNTFFDPRWFNRVRGSHDSVVNPDGTVTLDGETLEFADESLAPGTAIEVALVNNFYAYSKEEQEADRRAQQLREAEQKELDRLAGNEARRKAEALNAAFHLPIKWDVGIKDVLSGLSANSMGNGRNRATVNHILLLEDLSTGRMTRSKGSFLCTTASGSDGKNWSDNKIERWLDGDGKEYVPPVTCKVCQKIAWRLSRNG